LREYGGGILQNLGWPSGRVGGVEEHLQILIKLARACFVAEESWPYRPLPEAWARYPGLRPGLWNPGPTGRTARMDAAWSFVRAECHFPNASRRAPRGRSV
jgi:hypothetical protein